MPWNVIAQIGEDSYYPALDQPEPRFVATIDQPGSAYSITQHLLSDVFKAGLVPSPTAIDLFHLAAVIYTADLRIWRGYNNEDAWTRDIVIHFPVTDVMGWDKAAPKFIEFLSFLTGDEWAVHFRKKVPPKEEDAGKLATAAPDAVCLFSGGLDSFVGAVDLLSPGQQLALVGHYGNSQREQKAAYDALKPKFGAQLLPLWFYLVPPKMDEMQIVDSTMRARSFLFLALGTAVASALNSSAPLYIPENGPISLNVPLTPGRAGTHSTRTTHPHTIHLFRQLLAALGIDVILRTPYRFTTKGEMLAQCKDQSVLASGVHSTMSCSRPQSGRFHGRPVGQHCGYCVPCIIRRASLNTVNMDDEPRNIDVLAPNIEANETTGRDKRAFLLAIARLRSMSPLEVTSEILSAGPVDPSELDGLTGVFRRGLAEVEAFLSRTS
jgi:7-cyano-7-deazaguanine synthase in queuosine biosynthesis